MLKMKDQKKDKNAKLSDKIQKAKEIGAAAVGGGIVVAVGAVKFGKKAVQYAPKAVEVVAAVGKSLIK